jgi:hypothetical protein
MADTKEDELSPWSKYLLAPAASWWVAYVAARCVDLSGGSLIQWMFIFTLVFIASMVFLIHLTD